MKPSTWKQILERLEENLRNLNLDECDTAEEYFMTSENETMEWISIAEGKGKAFSEYYQRIGIQIQAEEDGID